MQPVRRLSIAVLAAASAFAVPAAAQTAPAPAASGVTLNATRVPGSDTVRITGSGPVSRPLEAALYATFSQDLPTVLLSRRIVSTDAYGRYDATVSLAPAYFRNAIVTVNVRALPDGAGASTTLRVVAPNVPAPPDDIPASVR